MLRSRKARTVALVAMARKLTVLAGIRLGRPDGGQR